MLKLQLDQQSKLSQVPRRKLCGCQRQAVHKGSCLDLEDSYEAEDSITHPKRGKVSQFICNKRDSSLNSGGNHRLK